MNTPVVELGTGVAVKRYRAWDQDQHRREWRTPTRSCGGRRVAALLDG